MKKYGIGVIGLGMGANLLPVNRVPDSRLRVIGVCDIDLNRADSLARKWNIDLFTDNDQVLLDQSDIDIIAVFSPDHLHAGQVIRALEAGKHIICTKPLVTNEEDAVTVCRLVREKGVKCLVGQTMRYEPQFVAARRLFDEGRLGTIIAAEAHYVHDMRPVFAMTPWRLTVPQDVMYGGVCHPIDVLRWFLGDVEEVYALGRWGGLTAKYQLMGNFMLSLRFQNGVIGRILGLFDLVHPPMPMMGLGLFGTQGSVMCDFTDQEGGKVRAVFDEYEIKSPWETAYPPEVDGAFGHGQTVLRYLKHFEQCLLEDLQPVPDCYEGAKSIAVCAAAYRSIRSGKPEKVRNEF